MISERDYQVRAVAGLIDDLRESHRVIAVSPTGSGKTFVAATLIATEQRWTKVLWLAHRYELVDQAYRTLSDLDVDVGILMAQEESIRGDRRVDSHARVQVASVQTVASRGVPDDIDLIVFDEAHRVMSDSYQMIADMCSDADVLGLTATPCRMDGRGLGEFFDKMRVLAMPSDLHAEGLATKPVTFGAPSDVADLIEIGLEGLSCSGGDYHSEGVARAVDTGALIGRVVSESVRIAPGVAKVVFACSVNHSQHIADEFARVGVSALHLDGNTQPEDREAILAGLANGDIEVVCNVDVLSEGWSLPSLGAVVVARPTKSKGRFLQMVGRVQHGSRAVRPIVIDHGANVQRLDLIPGEDIIWTLEKGAKAMPEDVHHARVCGECGAVLERGEAVCEECGREHEYANTRAEDRQELEVKLLEITRADLESRKARAAKKVQALADRVGAPGGWSDDVARLIVGHS